MTKRLIAFLLFLAFPVTSPAQEATVVTGLVTTATDGLPFPGATVAIDSLKLSAITGADGRYRITLPRQTRREAVELRVSAAGVLTQTFTLTLSAGTLTQDVALVVGLSEQVTVTVTTGSHIRRVDAESVLPVSVIDVQDLAVRAVGTGAELFEQLPWFGQALINERATGPNDARGDAASINLRGLGNNNTLVLLNGRRMAPHPVSDGDIPVTAVNVNSIPLAATQQMEILRDGASAIYGTDAVAGVVNAVLKKESGHAHLPARRALRRRDARGTGVARVRPQLQREPQQHNAVL
jgi:hypothetical protein